MTPSQSLRLRRCRGSSSVSRRLPQAGHGMNMVQRLGSSRRAGTRLILVHPPAPPRRPAWKHPADNDGCKAEAAAAVVAVLPGAREMFDGLLPIATVAIIYGIYPVSLRRGDDGSDDDDELCDKKLLLVEPSTCARKLQFRKRMSAILRAHPTGLLSPVSTVWWVVAVNALALWSCWLTVRDRVLQLSQIAQTAQTAQLVSDRFVAVESLLITCIVVLTPLIWAEASRGFRRLDRLAAPLMRDFGALIVPRCGPWPRRLAWLLFAFAFLSTPLLVYAWLFVVAEGRGSDAKHLVAGVFNVVRCFTLTLSCVAVFTRAADFAEQMAQQLAEEIARGEVRAPRLRTFRNSWLDLCALVRGLVVMPGTVLAFMLILGVMSVFFAFQSTLVIRSGATQPALIASIVSMAAMWNLSSLAICEAAHRAAAKVTVNRCFAEVLHLDFQLNFPPVDSETERELGLFARAVSKGDVLMSVGGFFNLRRATFTSIASTIVSNLIVLIQFQQSSSKKV